MTLRAKLVTLLAFGLVVGLLSSCSPFQPEFPKTKETSEPTRVKQVEAQLNNKEEETEQKVPAKAQTALDVTVKTYPVGKFVLELSDGSSQAKSKYTFRRANAAVFKEEGGIDEKLGVVFDDSLEREKTNSLLLSDQQPAGQKDALVHITSNKDPNVLIQRNMPSGKSELVLLRVTDVVKKLQTIKFEATPDNVRSFSLIPTKDGQRKSVLTNDWFTNWGAKSVAPEIIFSWDKRKLALDILAMKRRPQRDVSQLKRQIKEVFKITPASSAEIIDQAPPELAGQVYELIYSGRADEARRFLADCWPSNRAGKERYWSFLVKELKVSRYWKDIEKLNSYKL